MKPPTYCKGWTEFDWELEIRKDEARIHAYLNELPRFIDLPDEEGVILGRMKQHPELVPQDSEWGPLPFYDSSWDDSDAEEDFQDDWKKEEGADIYMLLQKLAYQWNSISASSLAQENLAAGISITCRYGKLLARMADVLDTDASEYPNLRKALLKRIIAETNTLQGDLNAICAKQENLSLRIETQSGHLQMIREKALDMLSKLA